MEQGKGRSGEQHVRVQQRRRIAAHTSFLVVGRTVTCPSGGYEMIFAKSAICAGRTNLTCETVED